MKLVTDIVNEKEAKDFLRAAISANYSAADEIYEGFEDEFEYNGHQVFIYADINPRLRPKQLVISLAIDDAIWAITSHFTEEVSMAELRSNL